jgi:hypothetical protein
MLKTICNKFDINVQSIKNDRLYNINTNIKMDAADCYDFFNIIKKNQLYNLLLKLNTDIISNIDVTDKTDKSENIKITFLDIDTDFSSFNDHFIHFNNKIILNDENNIELIGIGLYNSLIEYINVSFKYENEFLSINILFKNQGPQLQYFIEDMKAFMFRKILYRLKEFIKVSYQIS